MSGSWTKSVERRYGGHLAAEGIEPFWQPNERQTLCFGCTVLLTMAESKLIRLYRQNQIEAEG